MTVDVSFQDRRATITIRRPDVLNAMNVEVFDGLARTADEVAKADDVRVVIVTGEGRSFSSGIDTSTFGDASAGSPEEVIERAQAGFRKIAALPMPTVAVVRGHALGAGLQLALACDLRVVAADSSLGILESRYALIPDLGGTHALPALVGPGQAKRLIWLAERVTGEEAGRIGLAEIVVAPDELEGAAQELAARLEAAPPLAVRQVKQLVEAAARRTRSEGMDAEARAQAHMLRSADFTEAIAAFVEQRSAVYVGS